MRATELILVAGGFMESAIADTYSSLGLPTLLRQPLHSNDVAANLNLHADATRRFLFAAVYLGLARVNEAGEFLGETNPPVYSASRALAVLWLAREEVQLRFAAKGGALAAQFPAEDALHLSEAERQGWIVSLNGRVHVAQAFQPHFDPKSPSNILGQLRHYETVMLPMFAVAPLTRALVTGESQWEGVFGFPVRQPFDLYAQQPQFLRTFMRGMHLLNQVEAAKLAKAVELSGAYRLLDLGGASGAFAGELLLCHPQLEVFIYEPQAGIGLLKELCLELNGEAVSSRIGYIAGDFLQEAAGGGLVGLKPEDKFDRIVLGWIIHDWDDTTAVAILSRARAHLAPQGQLLLLELVLPDSRIDRGAILDMAMLLQTCGRERTLGEYEKLLRRAGFCEIELLASETRRRVIQARV